MKNLEEFPFHFTRHTNAEYKSEKHILESEDPEGLLNTRDQVIPDLPAKGKEYAVEKAKEFFKRFSPEKDVFCFFSSDEARAVETANIYRQVAHELGFQVLKPYNDESAINKPVQKIHKESYAYNLGEGEIRTLSSLSIHEESPLINSLFDSIEDLKKRKINWDKVKPDIKQKWEKARHIIKDNDMGTWSKNFFHHSDSIKTYFPELKSAKDLRVQFENIARLIRFAKSKIDSFENTKEDKKKINILGFGHETYLADFLNEYFDEHDIKNCETIDFSIDDNNEFYAKRREEIKRI